MLNACAQRVQCGDYYTVAATADGELIFWGLHSKKLSHSSAPLHGSDEDSSHFDMCSPGDFHLEQPAASGDSSDVALPKSSGEFHGVGPDLKLITYTACRYRKSLNSLVLNISRILPSSFMW
jgi:hypothetical protein